MDTNLIKAGFQTSSDGSDWTQIRDQHPETNTTAPWQARGKGRDPESIWPWTLTLDEGQHSSIATPHPPNNRPFSTAEGLNGPSSSSTGGSTGPACTRLEQRRHQLSKTPDLQKVQGSQQQDTEENQQGAKNRLQGRPVKIYKKTSGAPVRNHQSTSQEPHLVPGCSAGGSSCEG